MSRYPLFLVLSLTLLVKMIVGDAILVQEEPIISASTEEHSIQVPVDRAFMVQSTLEVTTLKATIISSSKALVVTLEMRQLMVQLVPVLLGETSTSHPPYERTITTIEEIGSGSAPPAPAPAPIIDIMEELTLQIVEQFFVMMKYCIEQVLSG